MRKLLTALFGTPTRRVVTLLISNAVFYGGAFGIHYWVDHVASSPALSFVAVAVWMTLGVINGFMTVVALGNVLLYQGHTEDFLRDEMAEIDARIDGAEAPDSEEDDLASLRRGDGGFRFAIYFVVISAVHLLITNSVSGSFMGRYTHPGVAVVHMRSAEPAVRRAGLDMLAERLDFKPSPQVVDVVLSALKDPNEGVAARATFVAGTLEIEAAVEPLAQLARSNEALTFVALIALGQIGGEAAAKHARALADDPVAQKEPLALAYVIGLTRTRAIERLREIYTQAKDDDTRVAAIWAIGRLRESRLIDFVADALEGGSLVVRCAAAEALGEMVSIPTIFETSAALRAAFEKANDPLERCPEVLLPVQEGGTKIPIVRYRYYQLVLIRALAKTDDPLLIKWLVKNQENVESRTHELMRKLYEKMVEKDGTGTYNRLKQSPKYKEMKAKLEGGPDAGVDAGPDAGPDAD